MSPINEQSLSPLYYNTIFSPTRCIILFVHSEGVGVVCVCVCVRWGEGGYSWHVDKGAITFSSTFISSWTSLFVMSIPADQWQNLNE